MTTCQICGRSIKSKNGTIALHGYKRPGQGWQTASCYGARHQPYEVSCSALAPAIVSAKSYRASQAKAFHELVDNPPSSIVHVEIDAWKRQTERTFEKPADFDLDLAIDPGYRYTADKYTATLRSKLAGHKREVTAMNETIKALEKRLADWKAPN